MMLARPYMLEKGNDMTDETKATPGLDAHLAAVARYAAMDRKELIAAAENITTALRRDLTTLRDAAVDVYRADYARRICSSGFGSFMSEAGLNWNRGAGAHRSTVPKAQPELAQRVELPVPPADLTTDALRRHLVTLAEAADAAREKARNAVIRHATGEYVSAEVRDAALAAANMRAPVSTEHVRVDISLAYDRKAGDEGVPGATDVKALLVTAIDNALAGAGVPASVDPDDVYVRTEARVR